ncbi:MAG: CRTAC1 family protein [Acidimicrobiales bacterium]
MVDLFPSRLLVSTLVVLFFAGACSATGDGRPTAAGADVDRPDAPSMELVRLVDVAADSGLDFRHSAFRWGTTGDPNAMMGGGLCWIDHDRDGWLDLFVVDTWSEGEWGRWRSEGALPSSRLYRNDRGRFIDVTEKVGAGLEVRGSGCVASDLDGDGYTDLYVTTERENVLLWNAGGERFDIDDGSAGANAYGWHSGAAVGDVDGDGRPDLFVSGYADLNRPIPGASRGFPNPFQAEPDLLLLNQATDGDQRPHFVDAAAAAGIEADGPEYGLGAIFSDVDRDGDLDLYVANDTQPNRLYLNRRTDDGLGFRLEDIGASAGVADDNAGMGVASGDYDGDGRSDLIVTNMAGQGHAVHRSLASQGPPAYRNAIEEMGALDLGVGRTGWGVSWTDLDLDTDLDLVIAQGAIPVTDLDTDREQLQVFENRGAQGDPGAFLDATSSVDPDADNRFLGRGLAAADYDNDGDIDLAVGTVGGHLGLLRNTGAGGHWLVVAYEPAAPGTVVTVTTADGFTQEREHLAGSSYLSSADPRAHFGLGSEDEVATVRIRWPDGTEAVRSAVAADQVLEVRPD